VREQSEDGRGVVWDVPYGPDPYQCLDLFLPNDSPGAPIVLFIHAGGWSVGDKSQYATVGDRLSNEGMVVATVNYRLSPAVQHPVHAEDVARAVAWCYSHAARYGADPERLCLIGHSSGAHLAALVALDPTYLAAQGLATTLIRRVVGIAGVGYDLDERYATEQLSPFLAPVFGSDSTRWAQAAPLRYVTPSAPAFLLIHGLSDVDAPPSSTRVFAAVLQRAGVATQMALFEGEAHISVVFAAAPLVLEFLRAAWPSQPTPSSPSVTTQ
jgi:acetyl esterase/lipase